MATSKSYYARPNYRFLSSDSHHSQIARDSPFELDESDLYYNHSPSVTRSDSPEYGRTKSTVSNSRFGTKSAVRSDSAGGTAASLPVNIPDWSKILKEEYRENRRSDNNDRDDDDDDDVFGGVSGRVPPHEFLARTRMASFSVHEGAGRTLKGGDLTRVRNAIWKKTGFQD